jgi:AGCS family alanine or glycine:cation symporter
MFFEISLKAIADYLLFSSCIVILLGCILLTIKTRFVQVRFIPALFRMLWASFTSKGQHETNYTIKPHKALFTAMSTTLGVGTIVAPVIAINYGGPGALLGFLLCAFFGSAATFTEVSLTILHRKKLANGEIMGGPMQYMGALFSPKAALWYAVCGVVLMIGWSAAQANQMAAILDSPLIEPYRVSTLISGGAIALMVLLLLLGGIKKIGSFSMWSVPLHFILYVGACLWIVLCNFDRLGGVFEEIFATALSPQPLASGVITGGFVSAMRWGFFKGLQCCEAGVGSQAIPHSMAETTDPREQGILSMLSSYSAGCLAFLSGLVALITGTWQDPTLSVGMSMVASSFEMYYSAFGIIIIALSTLLFAFGTILGNSYNGSQCFGYFTNNKGMRLYFIVSAFMVFIGSISDVKTIWSVVDIIMAFTVLPHMAVLVYAAYKDPEAILQEKKNGQVIPVQ